MKYLKDKNILYIGQKFFGYEIEIKNQLKKFGANVDFYDERPKNDFFTKLFIRLRLKLFIRSRIKHYYNNIYKDIQYKSYDYVFVIAPETLDYQKLKIIKSLQPNATFILYMWDAFGNKNSFNTIKLFNKIFTFDNKDAQKYNLIFQPLFYIKEYENIKLKKNYKYAVCFIGTAHTDRYTIIKSIKKQMYRYNLNMYTFLYLASKLIYWGKKIFNSKYHYSKINDFSFSSLSQQEIINVFKDSKVILDINRPIQDGLTARTIEALGANKKLITTNKNIINYDFYHKNNILIINRTNPIITEEFLKTDYIQPTKEVYTKYSLKNWIITIFT